MNSCMLSLIGGYPSAVLQILRYQSDNNATHCSTCGKYLKDVLSTSEEKHPLEKKPKPQNTQQKDGFFSSGNHPIASFLVAAIILGGGFFACYKMFNCDNEVIKGIPVVIFTIVSLYSFIEQVKAKTNIRGIIITGISTIFLVLASIAYFVLFC